MNSELRQLLEDIKQGNVKPETVTDKLIHYCALYTFFIEATSRCLPEHQAKTDPVMNYVRSLLLHMAKKCPIDITRLKDLEDAINAVENA